MSISGPSSDSNRIRAEWRSSPLLAAALVSWVGLIAFAVYWHRGWGPDDFYITYRYAKNLAQGDGFVYNSGERVFGLTDPGVGLYLGVASRITRLKIEWLASATYAASLLAIAVLLLREAAAKHSSSESILAGSVMLLCPFVWAQNGAAAPLTLLLLLGAVTMRRGRPVTAGLLAGVAVWVRPDAAIGVLALVLFDVATERAMRWRLLCPIGAVVAAGLALAYLYFGTPLPGTLEAKIAMSQSTGGQAAVGFAGFWGRAVMPLQRNFGENWGVFAALGVLGILPLWQRSGQLARFTLIYAGLLAVFYPLVGVPFFTWYILLPVIALIYGASFSVVGVARVSLGWVQSQIARRSFAAILGAVLVLMVFGDVVGRGIRQPFAPPQRLLVYKRAAEWLREHSEPSASVAYVEIGVLGYYSERRVEDLMGLVTPRVVPFIRQRNIAGAFEEQLTEFVLFHPRGRMAPIVTAAWFPRYYEEAARFEDRGFRGGDLIVYRRRRDGGDEGLGAVAPGKGGPPGAGRWS